MSRRALGVQAVFVLMMATAAAEVAAQGWWLDAYAGGARTGALAALPASNLVVNVRWSGLASRFYVSAAAPLGEDATPWGAAGLGGRWVAARSHPFAIGVNAAANGYAFRDGVADASGLGATLRAAPVVEWASGSARIELSAGRQEHVFRQAGDDGSRGVWEAGARASWAAAPVTVTATARWVAAPEAHYPYLGGQLSFTRSWGGVWAGGGAWFSDSLDNGGWFAGASVDAGRFGEAWAAYRDDPADPLYRNVSRRSWTVGLSVPLGRARTTPVIELAPIVEAGRVRIRLPAEHAGASSGSAHAVAVAGEFSDWKPLPMRLSGDEWVLDLELSAGVYRFAFVTGDGRWFVPEGYPGRIDDGMGGHVALLIVP